MVSYKDLTIFKKAFQLAMDIYEVSKKFPKKETDSLTDQIIRSSRSVCTNFAEAYRKRKYIAHFTSKLTDCDSENSETDGWVSFAFACNYITKVEYDKLSSDNAEVGKMPGHMIQNTRNICNQKVIADRRLPIAYCQPHTIYSPY